MNTWLHGNCLSLTDICTYIKNLYPHKILTIKTEAFRTFIPVYITPAFHLSRNISVVIWILLKSIQQKVKQTDSNEVCGY